MNTDNRILVEVPRTWWRRFQCEAVCEDALAAWEDMKAGKPVTDQFLVDTARLLLVQPWQTKAVRRMLLTPDLLTVLWKHADWYGYFWQEEAQCSWPEERLGLYAASRASYKLADRLATLIPDTNPQEAG